MPTDDPTWGRPSKDVPWCLIIGEPNGRITTACRGSWPTSDTDAICVAPNPGEQCLACGLYAIDRALGPRVETAPTVIVDGVEALAVETWDEQVTLDLGGEA